MFEADNHWYVSGDTLHATCGIRYAVRYTPFPFPLLRANGVSPLVIVDVASYSPKALTLKSTSTALANALSDDCRISGTVFLQGINTGFLPAGAFEKPPELWHEFPKWSKQARRRLPESDQGSVRPLLVDQRLEKTDKVVSAVERQSVFSFVKGFKLQDAYVTTVTVAAPRAGLSKFTGVVYGQTASRVAMVLRFIESIASAIDLS